MGCDGGTIPRRDELVKTKKKPEQKDKTSERAFRWRHCAVSQQRLQKPIVSCELGKLYKKDAVIENLLDKASQSDAQKDILSHIRSLKDIKELQLTENPAYVDSGSGEKGDGYIDEQKSKWICPISGQEMNGTFRFSFIWDCGCVLSDKAIKEFIKTKKSAEQTTYECLRCQKPFPLDNIIPLNAVDDEEIHLIYEKMVVRRAQAKKSKKESKKREAAVSSATNGESAVSKPTVKNEPSASTSSKVNGSSSSLSSSLSEPPAAKKSKLNGVAAVGATKTASKNGSSTSKGLSSYSVSEDPNASEAYKSLFTSHKTAASQQKAHWITYNPFYN